MRKVLYIRSSFDPGGTETLLLNLFNLKQTRIKFYYALIKDGAYIKHLTSEANQSIKIFRKRRVDLKVLLALVGLVKKNDIKIIHAHQEIELFYAVLLKFFQPSLKIFYSIHLYNPKKNWTYYLEKSLLPFLEKVILVSNSLREKLLRKGFPNNKLTVLHNAVKLPGEKEVHLLGAFARIIHYSTSDFIIMMIGNFVPEKDQLTIIRAFNKIKEFYPGLKIVFIGKELTNAARCKTELNHEEIECKVYFLGTMENAWQYLDLASLFVFSSKSETFGIAVIEALLNKTPVLASDIDVMRELSHDNKYFKLFKTGDADDLAEKIEWFMADENKSEIKRMVQLAYDYATHEYSFENYIEKLDKVYGE